MSEIAIEQPKPTTQGPCILCGSGSCNVWRYAALTADGHVDQAALHADHEIVPGGPELTHMTDAQTATFRKHGGRVAPLPPPRKARR